MTATWHQKAIKKTVATFLVGVMFVFSGGLLTTYVVDADMASMDMHNSFAVQMDMDCEDSCMPMNSHKDCVAHCIKAVDEYRSVLHAQLLDVSCELGSIEKECAIYVPRPIVDRRQQLALHYDESTTQLLTVQKRE